MASVFVEREGEHYVAQTFSFLATIDTEAKTEGTSVQTESIQYFATGDTATRLALHQDVRQAFIERLEGREVTEGTFKKDEYSKILRGFWDRL